ncbi:hypothetical protein QBC40DRAFT_101981 [Triangularia verruculosa]|uniref:Uncharacterized protein n=1 Tax=Triangularia verruculosa TaxID=2587418 RepID=A0AAN6XDL8_9PEZI|nr:hypothetical protein QBC40DRAFT_101981 [Triangularia verruculosa]
MCGDRKCGRKRLFYAALCMLAAEGAASVAATHVLLHKITWRVVRALLQTSSNRHYPIAPRSDHHNFMCSIGAAKKNFTCPDLPPLPSLSSPLAVIGAGIVGDRHDGEPTTRPAEDPASSGWPCPDR